MSNLIDTQSIEKYCEDALDATERKAFELRLEKDSEFAALYEQYLQLTNGIEKLGRYETLQYLNKIEKDLPKVKIGKSKSLINKQWMAIAASILVLLSLSLLLDKGQSNTDLYQEYHQAYPLLLENTVRGEIKKDNSAKSKAYEAYAAGAYQKAIKLFDSQTQEMSDTDRFYKANALLANQQSEEALLLFKDISEHSPLFDKQARWYIGLCYLELNQTENALTLFSEIANSTDSYKHKAKDILAKLQ